VAEDVEPSSKPAVGPVAAAVEGDDVEQRPPADEGRGAADAEAVARVLDGQPAAFDELVQRYQRQAITVSYRLLGNLDDAKDLVQDAFVKAYRSLDTLERPAAFGGWLLRIVTNLSLNFRRGRRLRLAQTLDGPVGDRLGDPYAADRPMPGHGPDSFAQSGDPARRLEGRELGSAMTEALSTLPDKQREALILFTVEELPQKEVADRLGCSVEAVKWHVFQARKRLRERLKGLM
jgi:RNA polymerase sigma-70 factor (ECF subfamily)